tara:strand:+ start:4563 stop:4739 length:177 start_codon:yes stop_codon:yes gene_type:complete
MNGKGDKDRTKDLKSFRDNYDKIFKKVHNTPKMDKTDQTLISIPRINLKAVTTPKNAK